MRSGRRGFSLIELIVVIGIIALLALVSIPVYFMAVAHAHYAACVTNMRGLTIAFISYAYDNNGQLPGRVTTGDKWPTVLLPYVENEVSVYVDPGDPVASKIPANQFVSNTANNSSFVFNGFSDLGGESNQDSLVSLFNVQNPGGLAVLGEQIPGGDNFYMDLSDDDQNKVLNKQAYFGGSSYGFGDGSVRFIKASQYSDSIWMVNPSYVIPPGN